MPPWKTERKPKGLASCVPNGSTNRVTSGDLLANLLLKSHQMAATRKMVFKPRSPTWNCE